MDETPERRTRHSGASFAGGTWGSSLRTRRKAVSSNRFGAPRVRGLGSAWSFHPSGFPSGSPGSFFQAFGCGQRPRNRLAQAELPRELLENGVPSFEPMAAGSCGSTDHLRPSLMQGFRASMVSINLRGTGHRDLTAKVAKNAKKTGWSLLRALSELLRNLSFQAPLSRIGLPRPEPSSPRILRAACRKVEYRLRNRDGLYREVREERQEESSSRP